MTDNIQSAFPDKKEKKKTIRYYVGIVTKVT